MSQETGPRETLESSEPQPGFASRQDAPDAVRAIQRRVMQAVPRVRSARQRLGEGLRRLRRGAHEIELYHQVDDPYSELALQAAAALRDRYDVELRFVLVGQADRLYAPEPDMLANYARRDCALIAPHYGLVFPAEPERPAPERVRRVERALAPLVDDPRFLDVALEAGQALWQGDETALARLEDRVAPAEESERAAVVTAGNARRKRLGHYSGGMFRYASEWFWGVDRLYHLEAKLQKFGALRRGEPAALRFDRPPLDPGSAPNTKGLRLEIFPSLRSPYTAMIFDESLGLAQKADIPVTLRPVMPMVMRGVPAPAAKGIYIFTDALREAEHLGVPYGDMFDPIGRPVERGFSLWPWARDAGRGAEFLSSFLSAAFAEGRNLGTDAGLRFVVERAGLEWSEASAHLLDGADWRAELEENRHEMYDALGLWGVPSYRLLDGDDHTLLSVWGQDRLWLVAATIRETLG